MASFVGVLKNNNCYGILIDIFSDFDYIKENSYAINENNIHYKDFYEDRIEFIDVDELICEKCVHNIIRLNRPLKLKIYRYLNNSLLKTETEINVLYEI